MSELNLNGQQNDESPANQKEKKGLRRLGPVRTVILIILIAVLGVSGYMIFNNYFQDWSGNNLYTTLEQSYLITPTAATPPLNTPTPIPSAPVPPGDPVVIIDEPPEVVEEPDEPAPPLVSIVENFAPDIWPDVDWDGLTSVNSDTAAWLLCVGTNINYPVVYSHDNAEYLKTRFDGTANKLGTPFVDARNSKGFTDRNTIIYGHNVKNHSMFWTLTQYKSQKFYNDHPTIRLVTPEGKFEIQLFAGLVVGATEVDTYWKVRFESDEKYMEWISLLYENSTFTSYVELTAEDRVVTLSTCSYDFSDARYIAIGKLVPLSSEAT